MVEEVKKVPLRVWKAEKIDGRWVVWNTVDGRGKDEDDGNTPYSARDAREAALTLDLERLQDIIENWSCVGELDAGELESLRREVAGLREQNEAYARDYAAVCEERTSLRVENKELREELQRLEEDYSRMGMEGIPLQDIVPRSAVGSCTECARLTAEAVLREERLEESRTALMALLEENERLKGEYEHLRRERQKITLERDQLHVQCKSLHEEKERLQGEVSQLGFYRKRYLDTYAELTISRESLCQMRIQRDELRRVLRGRR